MLQRDINGTPSTEDIRRLWLNSCEVSNMRAELALPLEDEISNQQLLDASADEV